MVVPQITSEAVPFNVREWSHTELSEITNTIDIDHSDNPVNYIAASCNDSKDWNTDHTAVAENECCRYFYDF